MLKRLTPGVGYDIYETSDTVSLVIDNGGKESSDHPFKVKLSGLKMTVVPGTVNSIMPKLDGTALDNSPRPTKTLSASVQVYLKCENASGYAFPKTVTVETDTSTPASTDSYLYIHIATVVVSGTIATKTAQVVETSLWAEYLKCGSSAGEYFVSRS